MWFLFALLSATFASIMQILLKRCLTNVDPFVATLVRNFFVLVLSTGLLFYKSTAKNIFAINKKEFIVLIILSLATFLAYLCFFLAMKNGPIRQVVVIDKLSICFVFLLSAFFFHEKITLVSIIGCALIIIGAILVIYH